MKLETKQLFRRLKLSAAIQNSMDLLAFLCRVSLSLACCFFLALKGRAFQPLKTLQSLAPFFFCPFCLVLVLFCLKPGGVSLRDCHCGRTWNCFKTVLKPAGSHPFCQVSVIFLSVWYVVHWPEFLRGKATNEGNFIIAVLYWSLWRVTKELFTLTFTALAWGSKQHSNIHCQWSSAYRFGAGAGGGKQVVTAAPWKVFRNWCLRSDMHRWMGVIFNSFCVSQPCSA